MIKIGGLQKLTLIDYPGRLAATVFLCGLQFPVSLVLFFRIGFAGKNKKTTENYRERTF